MYEIYDDYGLVIVADTYEEAAAFLFEHKADNTLYLEEVEEDDYDLEMGFNPYSGCYDWDC